MWHIEDVQPGATPVLVARPGKLVASWPRASMWHRWSMRHHPRRLTQLANRMVKGDFIGDPSFAPYLDLLSPRWRVFHIFDAWTPEGWGERWDRAAERFSRAISPRCRRVPI